MSTASSGLKDLHHLHLQSRKAREELDRGPKQIAAREKRTANKEAERDAQKEAVINLKKLADSKSLQLKTNEQKIIELKAKLNAAASNREYDIIRGQIEADTMANSVLEDEILEALENVDCGETRLKEIQEECEQARKDVEHFAAEVEAKIPGLNEEIERLGVEIKELEKMLPGDAADLYRRLVKQVGADALAPVEGNTCSNCFVQLSPQTRVELNSSKIIFCSTCGRLLYKND